MLAAKWVLEGLKSIEMGLCESCVISKQKRVSFTKVVREPKKVWLEMIHTDVWRPSPVPSLGGSKFYVTFIDDFIGRYEFISWNTSRMCLSSSRSEKTEVESQTGLKIKCLRSRNGGEYDHSEFKTFCVRLWSLLFICPDPQLADIVLFGLFLVYLSRSTASRYCSFWTFPFGLPFKALKTRLLGKCFHTLINGVGLPLKGFKTRKVSTPL